MNTPQLQSLRNLPIEEVAQRLGLNVIRHKALCPFHNDHHASLSFHRGRNTFRCFVCNAHGGTIDLAMRILHKGFLDACQWLADGSNICLEEATKSAENPSSQFPKDLERSDQKKFDASKYQRYFQHPILSPEARHFLFAQRRLDPRVVHWCRLSSWRDRQGTPWLQIPYFDPDGNLIGIQNRNLAHGSKVQDSGSKVQDSCDSSPKRSAAATKPDERTLTPQRSEAAPRFRFPQGSRCSIYNLPILRLLHPEEPLWIAEGASDCWALLSAGHKAIAIPSATLLNPNDLQTLSTLCSQLSTPFHMAPDQDLPGEQLFLRLQALLPNLTRHQLPQACKDYSDYYLNYKI